MCPDVSLCAERFSDLSCGAIITFHDRKHAFDCAQPRGVRGMKSSTSSTKSPKTRTQKEFANGTWRNRTKSPDVREKSSIIRQVGWSCCMSLVYERHWGRQVYPLNLEQMMSSFSSSSILRATCSCSANTHSRSDYFVQKRRTESKNNPTLLCFMRIEKCQVHCRSDFSGIWPCVN